MAGSPKENKRVLAHGEVFLLNKVRYAMLVERFNAGKEGHGDALVLVKEVFFGA